jgi:two-component system NtrC family sensor kinase
MDDVPNVLLVDDSVSNLDMLGGYLQGSWCKLLYATSGERALEVVGKSPPDCIVLDIMLPGIDGYETCRRLMRLPTVGEIPVLFLSALDQVADKVKGFEAGGVDYISKPVQKEELIARVRTHLELFRIRRENRRYALEMEALAEKRAQALLHIERLSTLGTLSAGVAHEINNPATFISVGIQTIERVWAYIEQGLAGGTQKKHDHGDRIAFALANVPEIIVNIKSGVSRIQKIVGALRSYAHAGESHKRPCDVSQCIADTLELCDNKLKNEIQLISRGSADMPQIQADPQQIVQVLVNIIINAVDAMEGRELRKLVVETKNTGETAIIVIEDSGPGIDPAMIGRIWDPFFTTKPPDRGTGLGLSISKGIIEDHGGTIRVEKGTIGGARFIIELPAYRK